MKFKHERYVGTGINHDKEEFKGYFEVNKLPRFETYTVRYVANRVSDNQKVHEELGYLSVDDEGELLLNVHMEEMPITTPHKLVESTDTRFVFEYRGHGQLAGFNSELVFEFEGEKFRYLHRWAMNGEVSDKSWCLLEPTQS